MVPEEGRMMDERSLSCPLDDALRLERELEDRLEADLLSDDLLLVDRPSADLLPVDLLPGAACFLVLVPFDLWPLLRRAVAVCFMACYLN